MIDFKQYKLSAFPSPEDERDYKLPFAPAIFEEVELQYPGKTKDQKWTSMCVAFSCSEAREITEYLQSGEFKLFSEGFIYGNRQIGEYFGEGMYPREALKNLNKYGAVLKEVLPEIGDFNTLYNIVQNRKEELYKKAEPYKITSYYRVYTPQEVITALKNKLPIIAMLPVYNSFYSAGKIAPIPDETRETLYGYHEVLLLGVKKIENNFYYKILNSWGENWGENGYCYLPLNYPIVEMWAITDEILPNPPQPQPQPNPQPNSNKIYALQVGVYLKRENALNKIKQLRNLGYLCYIREDKGVFRVFYGKYTELEKAQKMSKILLEKKVPNTIREI